MTITEMHIRFKLMLDKADTENYPNVEPEEVDTFLNLAQERFVKQRYGITNSKRAPFEATQKRTDDLRELVRNYTTTLAANTIDNKPTGRFTNSMPNDYWFMLNEEADILAPTCKPTPASGALKNGVRYIVTSGSIAITRYTGVTTVYSKGDSFTIVSGTATYTGSGKFTEGEEKRVPVKPIQHDDYNKVIDDPFNKPWKNQVMRLMYNGEVELLSDGIIDIQQYHFRYLKKPIDVRLSTLTDSELADHTHQEIVDMAVSIALENIESQRYQTQLNEVNKQE